jgi:hypothetical protein
LIDTSDTNFSKDFDKLNNKTTDNSFPKEDDKDVTIIQPEEMEYDKNGPIFYCKTITQLESIYQRPPAKFKMKSRAGTKVISGGYYTPNNFQVFPTSSYPKSPTEWIIELAGGGTGPGGLYLYVVSVDDSLLLTEKTFSKDFDKLNNKTTDNSFPKEDDKDKQ